MKNRATAERAAPRLGIVISVLLHAGLVIALFVSFSKKIDLPTDAMPVVPVDLVTIADQTNIAPTVKPDEPPPDVQPLEPPPVPDAAAPKIEIAPEAKKTAADKFNDVLKDLDKTLASKKPANARIAQRTVQGVGIGTAMTADLATALQSMVYRCWSPPVGSPHPERLVVRYELFLNRDGSVAQPPQLTPDSASAATSDPYMAAAAGAARRAIYTCAPYRLPTDRYNQWRDVVFTFDPRQLGQ
jgi:hypothetical protein